jgi:SAM-dependent methyltransferase
MTPGETYLRAWEALAQTDPLFAVLTDPRYCRERLTPEAENEFWSSGEQYVHNLGELFRTRLDRVLAPERSLDFGCGVGRLLIPIARRSRAACGVDASPTMLRRAREACDREGVSNVALAASPPDGERFDFINSALVFQHIPVRVGLPLLARLLAALSPGGLLALQLLRGRPRDRPGHRVARWLFAHAPPIRAAVHRWRGIPSGEPYVQMNSYPIGRVRALFSAHALSEVSAVTSSFEGFESVVLLARKAP